MAKRKRMIKRTSSIDTSKMAMRARNIVSKSGGKLHFLGGTALNNTVTEGMPSLVQAESSPMAKAALADAIQDQIRNYKHAWTITCAFFHEQDGKHFVRCERFFLDNMVAAVMDAESTNHMAELWKEEDVETRTGQLWIATPAKLAGEGVDMVEALDSFLEDNRFFDSTFMRGRLTYNALMKMEYDSVMEEMGISA